ncbi:hypothetical protein AQUCO_06900018v1 [Aquilegia coerulea]|uniref:MADS-box domain-containing protein n=1 Tax=Aquilegia coerulea TaxID=218851 RepID=A0A2G5CC62_AQUCA|nr:hypothetical protein AQUCO_06900018v1 [Aquilegia coerulea]
MSSGRKTTRRKKIAIKKIEIPKSHQVTFSKSINRIFKKPTELAFLYGAYPFVLILSPGGKPHVFVHPGVDVIVNQFLNDGGLVEKQDDAVAYNDYKCAGIDGFARRYNELNDQI